MLRSRRRMLGDTGFESVAKNLYVLQNQSIMKNMITETLMNALILKEVCIK